MGDDLKEFYEAVTKIGEKAERKITDAFNDLNNLLGYQHQDLCIS